MVSKIKEKLLSTTTATSTRRTHRSAKDWDALALEVQPILKAGGKYSDPEISDMIGSNSSALKLALARQGFGPHGEPFEVTPLTASRPSTLAKRVAQRRQEKAPWWQMIVETGKTYTELHQLLKDHGYTPRGERAGNGSSAE